MGKIPSRIKYVEIEERYVKRAGKVYWQWRFMTDKQWHERNTPYEDIPWIDGNAFLKYKNW